MGFKAGVCLLAGTLILGTGVSKALSFSPGNFFKKMSVNGAVSIYTVAGSKVTSSDKSINYDVGSAMIELSKTSSTVGFDVLAGSYAFPVVGAGFSSTVDCTKIFSPLPVAYVSVKPSKGWEVMLGRMPTIIGYESAFTYQNDFVERGLVWNMQPVLHDGIRIKRNYDNFSFTLGVNDGYYSASSKTSSGSLIISPAVEASLGYSFKNGSVAFNTLIPSKSARPNNTADPANKEEFDITGSYSFGKLSLGLDGLYVYAPKDDKAGVAEKATAYGIAAYGSYDISPFTLGLRIEYVKDNSDNANVDLVGIGDGNSAETVTFGIKYTQGEFFVKGETSLVIADKNFTSDNKKTVTRAAIETGINF